MSTRSQGRFILTVWVSVAAWLLVGCSSYWAMSPTLAGPIETNAANIKTATSWAQTREATRSVMSTPGPTTSPAPPTMEQQPASPQDSGRAGPPIETLCLEINQSFPEIAEEFSLPVRDTAEAILTAMGLTVVEVGEGCDATLRLSLTGEALWAQWESTPKCYNGAKVTGQAVLTVNGEEPVGRGISGKEPIPIINYHCTEEPADAPWERAWAGALLDGLVAFWGPSALTTTLDLSLSSNLIEAVTDTAVKLETSQALAFLEQMLEHENSRYWEPAVEALEKLGPEAIPLLRQTINHQDPVVGAKAAMALGDLGPEAVPVLIQALDDESPRVRKNAARSLGKIFWPKPLEAVPALIRLLGDEDEEVRFSAEVALKDITGQDFGQDADAWQAWWDAQPSQ